MKVKTNVTIEVQDDKGRRTLAPGEHNLDDAVAQELLDGGHAEAIGKGSKAAKAPAGGGGSNPPAGEFNADELLDGTIPEIVAKLDGLSAEQLDTLAAAEQDREKPRVGVIEAIAQAKAELQK